MSANRWDKTIKSCKGLAGWQIAVVVLAALALIGALVAFNGWVLMLLLGALHHSVSSRIPAVSYGGSVLIGMALGFVGQYFRGSSSS